MGCLPRGDCVCRLGDAGACLRSWRVLMPCSPGGLPAGSRGVPCSASQRGPYAPGARPEALAVCPEVVNRRRCPLAAPGEVRYIRYLSWWRGPAPAPGPGPGPGPRPRPRPRPRDGGPGPLRAGAAGRAAAPG